MSAKELKKIENKIQALRIAQYEHAIIGGNFAHELLMLEDEHETKITPYYDRRRYIITGEHEPDDVEADFPLSTVDIPVNGNNNDAAGIPGFWLMIFNNVPALCSRMQPYDWYVLRHLVDIRCVRNVQNRDKLGFTLEFYFEPNKYFTNEVLTKQFIVKYGSKESDPFNFLGSQMVDCTGCKIDWTKKNLTLVKMKKKLVKRASFFNFFDTPKFENKKVEPYIFTYYMQDFYLGYYLKERIIPRAILYYLGEALMSEIFQPPKSLVEDKDVQIFDPSTKQQQNENFKLIPHGQLANMERFLAEKLRKTNKNDEDNSEVPYKNKYVAAKLDNSPNIVPAKKIEMVKNDETNETETIKPKKYTKKRQQQSSSDKQNPRVNTIEPKITESHSKEKLTAKEMRKELKKALRTANPKQNTCDVETIKPVKGGNTKTERKQNVDKLRNDILTSLLNSQKQKIKKDPKQRSKLTL